MNSLTFRTFGKNTAILTDGSCDSRTTLHDYMRPSCERRTTVSWSHNSRTTHCKVVQHSCDYIQRCTTLARRSHDGRTISRVASDRIRIVCMSTFWMRPLQHLQQMRPVVRSVAIGRASLCDPDRKVLQRGRATIVKAP